MDLERCMHPAQRRCHRCGVIWESFVFAREAPPADTIVDGSTCAACIQAQEDAALRAPLEAAKRRAAEELDLRAPRRTPDPDDDFPYGDQRRAASGER